VWPDLAADDCQLGAKIAKTASGSWFQHAGKSVSPGISAEVLDLRTLKPLDAEGIFASVGPNVSRPACLRRTSS
jgi:pyruvate/2-oxoglutarate/acetoin dehydrogenase E1 component